MTLSLLLYGIGNSLIPPHQQGPAPYAAAIPASIHCLGHALWQKTGSSTFPSMITKPLTSSAAVPLSSSCSMEALGQASKQARPVLRASVLLSTVGVVLSALGLAALAHFILGLGGCGKFPCGAVISSTDAASVFPILRGSRLSLKYHTDSLLEVESGSNDPMAFMLTAAAIALMTGSDLSLPLLMGKQMIIGAAAGLFASALAQLAFFRAMPWMAARPNPISPFRHAFYPTPFPTILGGNGYLGTYLCGIHLGNAPMPQSGIWCTFLMS